MPRSSTSKESTLSTSDKWMSTTATSTEEVRAVENRKKKRKGRTTKSESQSESSPPRCSMRSDNTPRRTKGSTSSISPARSTDRSTETRTSTHTTSRSRWSLMCGRKKKSKRAETPKKSPRSRGKRRMCCVKVIKTDNRAPSPMPVFFKSQREYKDPFMICSCWPRMASKESVGRLIAVIRSAERVDRVFGSGWLQTEAPHGSLTPTDLNIPNNALTKESLEKGIFEDNPPITSFGKYTIQLTARALFNRGVRTKLIYCSPALRAIQTAEALAKFFKAKIAIEPGLVEPLAWYYNTNNNALDFHLDDIIRLYPVDTNYTPIMTMETILRSLHDESETEGENRIHFVLRSLAGQERGDSLIIVAHAITLAAAVTLADANTGGDSLGCASSGNIDVLEGEIDRIRLGVRFPPGSVVTLNLVDTGPPMAYELLPDVVPPLSYGEFYSNGPVFETVI